MIHGTIFFDSGVDTLPHSDLTTSDGQKFTVATLPMPPGNGSCITIKLEYGDRLLLLHDARMADLRHALDALDEARRKVEYNSTAALIDKGMDAIEALFEAVGVKP